MAKSPITPRAEDYAQWFQDVIAHAQLAEVAGVVKGCMVIRPHGYAIWEAIQRTSTGASKPPGTRTPASPC